MGLLEKAQERKQVLEQEEATEEVKEEKVEAVEKKQETKEITKTEETKGLLEKAKQRKTEIKEKKEEVKEKPKPTMLTLSKNCETIEEKKGFGWKGMGTRKIVHDKDINEYFYILEEPTLTEEEKEIKKELAHLFKMLADKNVAEILDEDKKKFLEDTLNQIIIDNNVKFTNRPIINKPEEEKDKKGKTKKPLFTKKEKTPEKQRKTGDKKNLLAKVTHELTEEDKRIKDKVFYHLFREFLGYGRIDIVMNDEGIEDISCDGHHTPIFIYHKKYDEITSNIAFDEELELNSFVVRLAQVCGKQISIYSPIVDGKLPDGSRLQTTLARTVTRGSTFTIRKFKENPLTPIDLIGFESISIDIAAYFWMAIEKGASVLFCGGTASGKTTALNALSLFIPAQHKIVTIEDTREVNLPHKNWIAGTTRQGFSASDDKTGKDIDMFDLIRAALRQRPKVVMVGEVRGKEAYSLFQAMATGHTSYATVHASDIHTLIQRLENPPISLPRALLTSLDIIVFQNAVDMGGKMVRRMTSVTEIVKLDPDTNQLIFMEPFRWISKTDDRFESSGSSKILNSIRIQSDWSEERLEQEVENRKLILRWMLEKDIRDYKEVGKIVNQYAKNPDALLKKAREELKK